MLASYEAKFRSNLHREILKEISGDNDNKKDINQQTSEENQKKPKKSKKTSVEGKPQKRKVSDEPKQQKASVDENGDLIPEKKAKKGRKKFINTKQTKEIIKESFIKFYNKFIK